MNLPRLAGPPPPKGELWLRPLRPDSPLGGSTAKAGREVTNTNVPEHLPRCFAPPPPKGSTSPALQALPLQRGN